MFRAMKMWVGCLANWMETKTADCNTKNCFLLIMTSTKIASIISWMHAMSVKTVNFPWMNGAIVSSGQIEKKRNHHVTQPVVLLIHIFLVHLYHSVMWKVSIDRNNVMKHSVGVWINGAENSIIRKPKDPLTVDNMLTTPKAQTTTAKTTNENETVKCPKHIFEVYYLFKVRYA
ncbi:hypothetical protein T01_13247 [Trichinella spiralis]|uniref:Uncharacterized protein n=1 Tax=Trichinella spiralis TaxID=6334 RepID=A0A0V1BCU7_TRISP|nr:hypothetical protein T01_13247 [Trichinella spiralis]